jgi:DNA-binding CsgD family transcriptional regulator
LVEEWIGKRIATLSNDPKMVRLVKENISKAAGNRDEKMLVEKRRLDAKLESIAEKSARLIELYAASETMTPRQFDEANKTLRHDDEKTRTRLEEVEKTLVNRNGYQMWLRHIETALQQFSLVWKELDNDEKKGVLHLLVEAETFTADRLEGGSELLLRAKLHLMPPIEEKIPYPNMRGISRTTASGMQRLTRRQMQYLHYCQSRVPLQEMLSRMQCGYSTITNMKRTILRNLAPAKWDEVLEMTKPLVESNVSQLELDRATRRRRSQTTEIDLPARFLSPVLIEAFVLYADSATVNEVAEKLNLTPSAAQGRRKRIMHDLGVRSMSEAVTKGRATGLI